MLPLWFRHKFPARNVLLCSGVETAKLLTNNKECAKYAKQNAGSEYASSSHVPNTAVASN
jgi:hypothetical protein